MSVTEVNRSVGSWELTLRPSAPQELINALGYFGHIAVTDGREDIRVSGDGVRRSARYVGVLRGITRSEDGTDLKGVGMASWLGDEDDKGAVFETAVSVSSSTFTAAVRALLPSDGSVVEGSFSAVPGNPYTGTHHYQTPRKAIDYVCDIFGAEWRVNGDATLDVGLPEALFNVTSPQAAIFRHGSGADINLKALDGSTTLASDVEDFTTRVLMLAQGEGESTVTAAADIAPVKNPYKDMLGNTVKRTRLVSESATDATNAQARAQLQLNRFTSQRDALTLSDQTHDIRGDVAVGDAVWVYDPDSGVYDDATEVVFHGERLNPVKLRVTEMTWSIDKTMGVYYRTSNGVWWDLTDHVAFESGATRVTVGGFNRNLISSGNVSVGSRPVVDSSVPGAPTFITPFEQSTFQTDFGETRAQIHLKWSQPLNVDGTAILDGDHYEIRFRTSSQAVAAPTWSQIAAGQWDDLGKWNNPLKLSDGPWDTAFVGFDFTEFSLIDLTPGRPYEVQIRAVDAATPPHFGEFSASVFVQVLGDTDEPSTPAAPEVAASQTAILVAHSLGKSSGGTFNLELDLNHLEVHRGAVSTFTPDAASLLGYVTANAGNLIGQIKAVKSFQVAETTQVFVKVIAVDRSGNRSNASDASPVTAQLIDSAHIASLTADKIDAGTLSASYVIGGEIATALSGARVKLFSGGLEAYTSGGVQTVDIDSSNGSFMLRSSSTGSRITIDQTGIEAYLTDGSTKFFDLDIPSQSLTVVGTYRSAFSGKRMEALTSGTIRFYPTSGTNFGYIENLNGDIRMRGQLSSESKAGWTVIDETRAALLFGTNSAVPQTRFQVDPIAAATWAPIAAIRIDRSQGNPDSLGPRMLWGHFDENGDIGTSFIHYDLTAAQNPHFYGANNDTGLIFASSLLRVANNDLTFGDIAASAFLVNSDPALKDDITDISVPGGALAAVRRAPARKFKYLADKAPRKAKPGGKVRKRRLDRDGNPAVDKRGDPVFTEVDAEWTAPKPPAKWKYGPMADELPAEIVETDEDGNKMVALNNLIGLVWKAVEELADRLDALEGKK